LEVHKWLGGIVIGISLGMASCSNGSSSSDELIDSAPIVIVNNEKITLEKFKKDLKTYKKKFRVNATKEITPEELTWLKNRVLEQTIHNLLLSQEIKINGIEISQEELEEALSQTEAGYTEDSFEKQLAFEGSTRKEWANAIENNLLIKKLISNLVNSKVSVSEPDMRRYFNENASKFHKREQVRALHIMVETEEEIRTIQKELESKQKDFSVLATEFSLGPEGAHGGDLGYFEAGQMPEEFDNVFKLKTNSVSDIIRTPYGFHLFKVVDKVKERKMSFDESRKQVEKILLEKLQDSAFQKWLIQLKGKSEIEIQYENFEKIK
jgi:parvulin-like peptidyl-prolyl isomerase